MVIMAFYLAFLFELETYIFIRTIIQIRLCLISASSHYIFNYLALVSQLNQKIRLLLQLLLRIECKYINKLLKILFIFL